MVKSNLKPTSLNFKSCSKVNKNTVANFPVKKINPIKTQKRKDCELSVN